MSRLALTAPGKGDRKGRHNKEVLEGVLRWRWWEASQYRYDTVNTVARRQKDGQRTKGDVDGGDEFVKRHSLLSRTRKECGSVRQSA